MKKQFNNRLEAIDWIAGNSENEAQFEVMRERLNFNFIYTQKYFLDTTEEMGEIIWLEDNRRR